MAPIELKKLQYQHGPKAGAITWALSNHGHELQKKLEREFPNEPDIYHEVVAELFATNFDSTREMLESDNVARLHGWSNTIAARIVWKQAHRTKQHAFEHDVDLTTDGEVSSFETTLEDEKTTTRLLALVEALKSVKNTKAVQTLILHSQGYTWAEVAKMTGFSSAQAAQKASEAPRFRRDLSLAYRALCTDEICSNIASDLSQVAWSLPDLDEELRDRVDAHVNNCPSCAEILETHDSLLARAGAFFPVPALAAAGDASLFAPLHAGIDWITAKAYNTYALIVGQSTNGTWTAPRTAAVAAVGAIAVGGGGAALEVAPTPKPKASAQVQPAPKGPESLLDRIKPPPEKKAKPKKKKPKNQAPPPPAATPAPPPVSTPKQAQSAPVDDGSSEFLPEVREAR